jgi:hypothetical protein
VSNIKKKIWIAVEVEINASSDKAMTEAIKDLRTDPPHKDIGSASMSGHYNMTTTGRIAVGIDRDFCEDLHREYKRESKFMKIARQYLKG